MGNKGMDGSFVLRVDFKRMSILVLFMCIYVSLFAN